MTPPRHRGTGARICPRRTLPSRVLEYARAAIDPPDTTSLAWPGADPRLATAEAIAQLGLFDSPSHYPHRRSSDGADVDFNPSAFAVERLEGRGTDLAVAPLLRRHYLRGRGFPGPTFALRARASGQLVGVACFARFAKPRWARETFQPTWEDRRALATGDWTEKAYHNRLVHEAEYLNLSRMFILPPDETDAPLGSGAGKRGAATWFTAQCIHYFAQRNHQLWIAQTMHEQGRPLPPTLRRLLEAADLANPTKGLGFVKAICPMADPHPAIAHVGYIYQYLGMYYGGRSGSNGYEVVQVGARSGETIYDRTISKATKPGDGGHDTAALRLAWEGAPIHVEIRDGDKLVSENDGSWIRDLIVLNYADLDDAIADRWDDYQAVTRAHFGQTASIHIRYRPGSAGLVATRVPGKHRYYRPLGAPYWAREVMRRCKHVRAQILYEDAVWESHNRRGRRPDLRRGYYPTA